MNIINLIKIAFNAIRLNRTRAFLTMLGIIIGVASVIAMLAIGEGSKESIRANISSMGSNMLTIRPGAGMQGGVRQGPDEMQSLTLEDYEAIRDEAELVSYVSPMVNSGGQAIYRSNNWPTSIYGISPEYLNIKVWGLKEGSMFTAQDIKSNAKLAVLGQTVVDNLFPDGTSPIGQTVRFNSIPFKVIGVLEEKGESTFGQDQDDVIMAPYTAVQKRIQARDFLQSIVASAKSEDQAEAAVEEISTLLRENHKLTNGAEDDFNVFSQEELISTFSSTSEMLTILLVAIASISLVVGGIGIMNIMYVSVKERTREIGLRMAVGARGNDILLQFLIEAVLISITGGLIGVLSGLGTTRLVATFAGWPTSVTLYSIVLSFIVCTITGIFFGWYPARKASSLDPITALRYE